MYFAENEHGIVKREFFFSKGFIFIIIIFILLYIIIIFFLIDSVFANEECSVNIVDARWHLNERAAATAGVEQCLLRRQCRKGCARKRKNARGHDIISYNNTHPAGISPDDAEGERAAGKQGNPINPLWKPNPIASDLRGWCNKNLQECLLKRAF